MNTSYSQDKKIHYKGLNQGMIKRPEKCAERSYGIHLSEKRYKNQRNKYLKHQMHDS